MPERVNELALACQGAARVDVVTCCVIVSVNVSGALVAPSGSVAVALTVNARPLV